jgi:hypothetical protein
MSVAAIERVRREFTWAQKASQISAVYRDVLDIPNVAEERLVDALAE